MRWIIEVIVKIFKFIDRRTWHRRRFLKIIIIHSDFSRDEFKKGKKLEQYCTYKFKTVPKTYLNDEDYQGKGLYDAGIHITEFLDTIIWQYEKVVIIHKFEGE